MENVRFRPLAGIWLSKTSKELVRRQAIAGFRPLAGIWLSKTFGRIMIKCIN